LHPIVRGFVAGAAGTAAMSLSELAQRLVRRRAPRPIDYDTSEHVVIAAARVLGMRVRTRAQARLLFVATHGGYGSLFGLGREVTARLPAPEIAADAAFFAACEGMALACFPLLGGTPPPWRWRAEPLIASVFHHAVYAAVVGAARRRLLSVQPEDSPPGVGWAGARGHNGPHHSPRRCP
jgi:hypothetical protein